MNTLKIAKNYNSRYEALRDEVSHSKFFNEKDWRTISLGNTNYTLESYADVLNRSNDIDVDLLNKEYNFEYADASTRVASLYNEVYANRDNTDAVRERYAKNDAGAVIVDDKGEAVIEKYTASDYDYFKSLIKEQNDVNYEKWLREQEQERKDSMNGFVKFLSNVGSFFTELGYGFTKQVNDVVDFVGSLGMAAGDAISGKGNFGDKFTEHLSDDEGRPFQFLEDAILEFESKYTDMRDLDGNYTNVGKYIGQVSFTLGQMIPSVLVSKGLGTVGVGAKVTSAASQLVFYTGMTSGNIRDTYEQFALQGISVPSEQIIANSVIKSVLQWGVEVGLGKILGGSALDNLVFGRSIKGTSSTTKSLTSAAMKRLAGDFAKEGLEEVLQDTSDFLVDRGFMYVINENFGTLTELNWQSLMDAFLIGGIASFAGNAYSIVKTKSKGFDGNLVQRKMAAWEYGLNLQSFVSNYDEIMKSEKYDDVTKTKINQGYVDAMTEMYASYRIIASIYGEIGEERFVAANKILTEITNAAKEGRFDNAKVRESAEDLYESVFGENNLAKEYADDVKKKLEEAKLAEQVQAIVRGEEIEVDDNSILSKAMKFIERNKKVNKVIATKYGENVVQINDTAIVPRKFLEVAGPLVVNASIKEQELVEDVINNSDKKYKINLDEIVSTYKKLTGEKKVTTKKAVTVLLLDENLTLFRTLLVTANKDTYSFLSGLGNHLKMLSITDVADAVHKKALANIVKRMSEALVDYLKVQPNANYELPILSKTQIDSIRIERWANNIYSRVITGEELSERDMNVLNSRINNLPIKQEEKQQLLNYITSANVDLRESAMRRIDGYYNNIFTTKYDGKTYMPMNSIPNMAFNNYLKNNNLTLKNWLSLDALDNETKTIIVNTYGEVNENTLYKHRVKMFKSNVNNMYGIQIKSNNLYIVDKDKNIVGFSNYNKNVVDIIEGKDVGVTRNFQTTINNTKDVLAITKSLLTDSISDVMANMVTIDDIMYNPDLLNDDIREGIIEEYGNTSVQSTFLYLRKFLIESTKNISIVAKPDGGYMFVNVKPMDSIFKTKKIEITKDTELSDIINSSYLKGVLATTKIVITNEDIAAEYVSYRNRTVDGKKKRVYENTIYIGKKTAEGSKDYLRFAIAHELEHVIQFENKLSLGMNQYWLQDVKQSVKNQIVADVKKHKPELFKDDMTREQQEKVVSNFIYHTSGESMAMGLDATEIVDFYPTMVTYTNNDTVITMPWGTTYQLKQGISTTQIDIHKQSLIKLRNNLFEVEYIKDLIDYENNNIKTLPLYDYEVDRNGDFYDNIDLYISHPYMYNQAMKYIEGPSRINRKEFYNELISRRGKSFKRDTLKIAYDDFVKDKSKFSFDEFLNTDLLYIRLQDGDVRPSNFVSVSGGITSILQIMNSQELWQRDNLIIGTFKPKDALCYFNTVELEFLLPTDKLKDSKIYDIVADDYVNIDELHTYENLEDYVEIPLKGDDGKIHTHYRMLNRYESSFIDTDTKELFVSEGALENEDLLNREFKYQNYDDKRLVLKHSKGRTISFVDSESNNRISIDTAPDDVKTSLIKIADNLWEVEGIKDLVEVNKEYVDNVKPEFNYGEKRDISFSYSTVNDEFPSIEKLFKISNYRDNKYLTFDDALNIAQELPSFDYIYERVVNEAINRKIIEEKYRDEILRLFEEGWDDIDSDLLDSMSKVVKIVANYVDNSYDFYNDFYSKKYHINDSDIKRVFDKVYEYVIRFNLDIVDDLYDLLNSEAGKVFKNITLKKLYDESISNKNLSYSEFLNLDIPYFRFQFGDIKPSDFVSVTINVNNEKSFVNYLNNVFEIGSRWSNSDKFIVGTVKLKNVLCYIDNGMNEVLLPTSELAESKIYDITHSNDFKNNNMYLTKSVPSIISSEDILPRDRSKNYEKELFYNILKDGNKRSNIYDYLLEHKNGMSKKDSYELYTLLNAVEAYYSQGKLNYHVGKQYLKTLYQLVLKHSDFENKYSFYEDSNNIGFINNDTGELFISEFNTYVTNTETGNVITDEQVTTDLGPDDVRMSLAKNIKSDTEKVKNEPKFGELTIEDYPSIPKSKYKKRKFATDEQGNVKTKMTEAENIVAQMNYKYDYSKEKKRYLSLKEAKGTNLEYFYKKYKRTQLDADFKRFIASTTNRNVAPVLMERINGKKAGTLTPQNVMDYFRDTDLDEMDETTFELINKAFFKNKFITTPKMLKDYINDSDFYYAARRLVKGEKLKNKFLLEQENPTVAKYIVDTLLQDNGTTDEGKKFIRFVQLYRQIERKNTIIDIDINEKYLKMSWMRHFDGSLESAGLSASLARVADLADWNITGEARASSIETSIGEDLTIADTLADEGTLQDIEDIMNKLSGVKKREALLEIFRKQIGINIAKKYGFTEEGDVPKEGVKKAVDTLQFVNSLSTEQLNKITLKRILADIIGIDYEKALDNPVIDTIVNKAEHTSQSIVGKMKGTVGTIKKHLQKGWDKKRFLSMYGHLFTDELDVKTELYKNGNRLKDVAEVKNIWYQVIEAKDDVLDNVFVSAKAVKAKEEHKKAMNKAQLDFIKAVTSKVGKKEVKVIQVNFDKDYISIDTNKNIPEILKKILNFEFTKLEKTKVQYISDENSYHYRTSLKEFLSNNAETLNNLVQQDVDDIVDFYSTSALVDTGLGSSIEKTRLYYAVQAYLSGYLLNINTNHDFILSEEQRKILNDRLEGQGSIGGEFMANVKTVVKEYLHPEKDIVASIAQANGVEVNPEDVKNLANAINTGDAKKIEIAKKQMYENTIKNHRVKGNKTNVFDRILQFQRVAMLSGPGTWLRNKLSNFMITQTNKINDLIGNLFTNKYKRKVKGQYKLVGTKVSTETTKFIKTYLIDNGLYDSMSDSLIKYDPRSADKKSIEQNIAKMISKNIATDIFYNNYLNEKVSKFGKLGRMTKENINKWYKFVFRAMSDDKSVQKATETYFGKILEETGADLSKGLTNQIQELLSEAYTLAAFDYMHKPNVFNKIEAVIKNKGGTVPYFIYKQIFPFAGAAWNWFKEGLNYTPVGLIKSIVKFANMESTIAKYEDAYEKGETNISSKLARYTLSRNIGKGVIGSIGTIIGVILAACGIVRLDEEDDKYKLYCFDTHLDISEVFGTQGIFLGMSVTQSIVDSFDGEFVDDEGNFKVDTLLSVFSRGFSTMMMESNFADFWNTVRFNGDIGDYAINAPFNSLQMFIPNWYKTVVSITEPYKVQYSAGIKGKIERLGATIAPWAYPKQVDVYTGEYQLAYKGGEHTNWLINAFNKMAPIKIQPYNVTDNEKFAVELGVNKGMLTGRYTINDKSITLNSNEVVELNTYYGQLNKKDLDRLMTDKDKYEVKNDKGNYVKLYYSKMTDKQKATVIKRIMSNNSSYAKVYVLTAKGYKYYASTEEYKELVSLGITENVYRKTNKKEGFVEP